MHQQSISSKPTKISIFREIVSDQYIFYRLDDLDRQQTHGITLATLSEFVEQYRDKGGLNFFFSEVIAKGMAQSGETITDIRDENDKIIWTNSSDLQA